MVCRIKNRQTFKCLTETETETELLRRHVLKVVEYVSYVSRIITGHLQVTHSTGNHGQGLAWAAKAAGLECVVVVPNDTPRVKCDAISSYGARLVFCQPSPTSRYMFVFQI